jgi:hypothetical protein
MRRFVGIVLAVILVAPLRAQKASATMVADALDWYSVWWGADTNEMGTQNCSGELRGRFYAFRCDPLAAMVFVDVDDSGSCTVRTIFTAPSPEEEVKVFAPTRPVGEKAVEPQDCGELPLRQGSLEFKVTPRARPVDNLLTARARDAALAYGNGGGGMPGCVMRFPKVKAGDPFVHVYVQCGGLLDGILEFPIRHGQPGNSPSFIFNITGSIPAGIERLWDDESLWLGFSKSAP